MWGDTESVEETINLVMPGWERMQNYENTRLALNYGQTPFIYYAMNGDMDNIDYQTHSMFVSDYPVSIYSASSIISKEQPMTIDGCLPAGTTLDIYLAYSGGGNFSIVSDCGTLYQEELPATEYQVSGYLSGYYPYSTSDKKITLTLTESCDELVLSADSYIGWAGMDITLPEEYAVERWYTYSGYDAWLNGDPNPETKSERVKTSNIMICPNEYRDKGLHITIHDDVTYTSESIFAAATAETQRNWITGVHEAFPKAVVRFENANVSPAESAMRYYEDMISVFNECGYDWYSNDYDFIRYGGYLGAQTTHYDGYDLFDMNLLKLFQKYR